MTPELWSRIENIVEQVEAAPEPERAALLDQLSGNDPEIKRYVNEVLGAAVSATRIHDAIGGEAAEIGHSQTSLEQVGPWRILRRIGHGGMGAVYEAARVGDFTKRVALKLLRHELDSDPARLRFQQERQTLASLEHPYIARLIDGGQTDYGSPWLALEFVDGQSIDKYCEGLTRTTILKLFLKVCEAVTYAHSSLIVHRDLKPANILVTPDGTPKLLDFGIAKLLEPGAVVTMTGFVALTPQYASPEQIRGEAVTTGSDVYSLGLVLYEILTGRKPYTVDPSSVTRLAQTVCETPPAAPGLDEDLDNILLMALRKEPARRYASAADLAADIERSLTHQPVRARADSLPYRTRKFIRRNAVSVAAAILVVSSLATGLGVAIRQAQIAKQRFDDVRQLATKFLFEFDRDIRQLPGSTAARERLVSTALTQLDKLARGGGSDYDLIAEVAQAYQSVADVQGMPGLPSLGHMDQAESSYRKACAMGLELISRAPRSGAQYRAQVATCHARLGYLLMRSGRATEARPWMLKALDIIQPNLTAKATALEYRAAANTHTYLSQLDQRSNLAGASEHAAAGARYMREYARLKGDTRSRSDLARALFVAAQARSAEGDLEAAVAGFAECENILQSLRQQAPNDAEIRRQLAVGLVIRASIEGGSGLTLGRPEQALAHLQSAITLLREDVAADSRNVTAKVDLASALWNLAMLQPAQQGLTTLRESLAIMNEVPRTLKGSKRWTGRIRAHLSTVLRGMGRTAEANQFLTQAEADFAGENFADPLVRGDALVLWEEQAETALAAHQTAMAVAALRQIVNDYTAEPKSAADAYSHAYYFARLARAQKGAGDAGAAEQLQARAASFWEPFRQRFPSAKPY